MVQINGRGPTEITGSKVLRRQRLSAMQKFCLRNPRFSKITGSVVGGGALAFIDRAVSNWSYTPETLFFTVLAGLGLGWMITALSGRKAQVNVLEMEKIDLKDKLSELQRQGTTMTEGEYLFVGNERKYKVLRKLGEGSMGEVWLVENLSLGRLEVLKRIRPELLQDASVRKMLDGECRSLASIDHPNVVGIFEYFMLDETVPEAQRRLIKGLPGFTMEFVDGPSLHDRLDPGYRFLESEFRNGLTIEALCKAIEASFKIDLKVKEGRGTDRMVYAIEGLNQFLRMPNIYDRVVQGRAQINITEYMQTCVRASDGFRNVAPEGFDKLDGKAKRAIGMLNRLILEQMFPLKSPQSGGMEAAQAVEIAIQILNGLEVVHSAGLVHRDLKPENLIVPIKGSQETIKIVDFGIVKDLESGAQTTAGIKGTPLYMAPEQWQQGKTSPQTDFWALGTILWEMLYGTPPFHTDLDADGALQKIFRMVCVKPHPAIPEDRLGETGLGLLKKVFAGLLGKRADDRYQSHAKLRENLEALKREYEKPPVQKEVTIGSEGPRPEPAPSPAPQSRIVVKPAPKDPKITPKGTVMGAPALAKQPQRGAKHAELFPRTPVSGKKDPKKGRQG